MKFVDIKNDVAFRKIFGNENRKEVLISFLNAVLLLADDQKIVSVDILTPYQLPTIKGGKVTIVDVKARDQNQKTYIVEMQVAEVDGFDKRVLYYASKSYSSQIERGDQYEKLNPTFFIGILDFEATKNASYLNRHKIIDLETGENFIKDIEFNFIELPKFNKTETELTSIIDQWVYFIKNAENLQIIPENITDKGLKFAYQDADKHNWTKEELEAYDYVLMREQDERGRLSFATKKALKEGLDKGLKEGLDKGLKEGEMRALEGVTKKLLRLGLPLDDIIESTGLTADEIGKLNAEE
jgi:predicted transposase/invertase (TIGR01784 family)